jgi:Ca2+-binding RTX toxin-like protein
MRWAITVLLAASVAAPASAQAPSTDAGGSATISGSSSGPRVGNVDVTWTAECPNPSGAPGHFWSVEVTAYHEDGSHANYRSTAESGVTSDSQTERLLVHVAPDLRAETFRATVTLSCYPYPDMLIGQGSLTVGPAAGADGGGGGHGGGGHGGTGTGGGGGGSGDGAPTDPIRHGGCANEVKGTAGSDVLDGGADGDLVLALGGDDRVHARAGDDCLVGAAGDDRLLGGAGYDRLTGGSGADRLDGGSGDNAYDAGSGDDRVDARNGRSETVRCGPGDDAVRADANDRLLGCEQITGAR